MEISQNFVAFSEYMNFNFNNLKETGMAHRGRMHDKQIACRTQPRIIPQPLFLVTAEAYLSATLGLNISDVFDLCHHWMYIVRDLGHP